MKWPRYVEILLGVWLLISPWVLDYGGAIVLMGVAVAAGLAVIALDVYSILRPKSLAYLMILGVILLLWGYAYFIAPAELTGTQNNVATAFLLAMFAILPTEATRNSPSWREYHRRDN